MQKKYNYKKYISVIILIAILNAFQFYFSTQIPKFLSDNINTGIINGGVSKIIYPVMDEETFNMLSSIDNKDIFIESYTNIDGIYKLNKDANTKSLEKATDDNLTKITHSDSRDTKIQMIASSNKKLNNNLSMKYIINNSIMMFIYSLISSVFVIISSFIISYYVALFTKELREKLFKKIEYFSMKNISNIGIGSLITRTTNDINNLQGSLNIIFKMSFAAPIALVVISWQAYSIAPSLMKVILYMTLILLVAVIIAVVLLLNKIEKIQKLTDKINKVLREILSGKRVIRAFNKQEHQNEKFVNVNKESFNIAHAINKVISFINPFAGFMINVSSSFIIYYIAKLLPINNIGIGNTFAFVQYAVLILVYFLLLINVLFFFPTALISFRRINEVLDEEIDIKYDNSLQTIDKIETLEFKNVDFSYDNSCDKVLSNVSFKVNKNETLGIIGSTGSGKSTIIKLILRFLDYSNGQILVNGIDIKDISLYHLRERLAYTPQKSKLFSGSVLENVAYKDFNPDINRAKESIRLALATEFADIDNNLNQSGTNLSGGQKQRISIARSIYKNSDIMLFDDSFSALDNTTDSKIRENLKNLSNIKIIVSQKISTIKEADKILVLDKGSVIGFDNHDNLLKSCSVYQELVNTQEGGAI